MTSRQHTFFITCLYLSADNGNQMAIFENTSMRKSTFRFSKGYACSSDFFDESKNVHIGMQICCQLTCLTSVFITRPTNNLIYTLDMITLTAAVVFCYMKEKIAISNRSSV